MSDVYYLVDPATKEFVGRDRSEWEIAGDSY